MNLASFSPGSQEGLLSEHMVTLEAETRLGLVLRSQAMALFACAAAFVLFFWPTLSSLVSFWTEDSDFSHGFLIPVVSGAIIFANRKRLAGLRAERSLLGLVVLFLAILVFFTGHLSMTNTLQRAGCWGALLGGIWFLLGTLVLRAVSFPLLFLLFAIPPPYSLLLSVRLWLKALATRVSADALGSIGFTAVPEGNVLALGEHRLEVADACSGIRSLMAIVATAVLFSYLFRTGFWKGSFVTLMAVPVTVAVNVARVVLIATALARFDLDLTRGTAHELIGMAVFGLSLVLLYFSWRFCDWFSRWKSARRAA